MYKTFADLRAKRAKGDNGFTLIELLVVVVILGVLIAIAIPVYLNYRKGANDAATESDVRNTISILEVCNASGGAYPAQATAVTWTTSAANTPCTGQNLSLSANSSVKYVTNAVTASAPAGTSYIIAGNNSAGAGKYYCYNSSIGGAVKEVTAANLGAATC